EGRIVNVEGMSPTTVIQHLRELKRAGVIDGRIFGLRSHYWICNEALINFKRLSLELFFRLETLA
ncbi:MAG: transcriptional regulator, partial [Bacteroidota bacterium]